jgi:ribosome-associated protein
MAAPDAQTLVTAIAVTAADRKARDLVEVDLRGLVSYTDYFVICTGGSDRHVKAIHDAIAEGMSRSYGVRPRRVEGLIERRWVLMDYLDVVVHIFTPPTRDFYRLESLWGEAPVRRLGGAGPAEAEQEKHAARAG